ncbi:hypothetical protein QF021_002860 [Acidovorax delafieldii]|nr:hypothetical protein [Acidovorax delafieldii]
MDEHTAQDKSSYLELRDSFRCENFSYALLTSRRLSLIGNRQYSVADHNVANPRITSVTGNA